LCPLGSNPEVRFEEGLRHVLGHCEAKPIPAGSQKKASQQCEAFFVQLIR